MNFTLDGKDTVPGLSRHIPAGTGDRANCISAHEDMIASPVNATLTHHDGDGEGETRAAVSLLLATAVVIERSAPTKSDSALQGHPAPCDLPSLQ